MTDESGKIDFEKEVDGVISKHRHSEFFREHLIEFVYKKIARRVEDSTIKRMCGDGHKPFPRLYAEDKPAGKAWCQHDDPSSCTDQCRKRGKK